MILLYAISIRFVVIEIMKDTLEIPLDFGLRKRDGIDGWWFGPSINSFYINFVKP